MEWPAWQKCGELPELLRLQQEARVVCKFNRASLCFPCLSAGGLSIICIMMMTSSKHVVERIASGGYLPPPCSSLASSFSETLMPPQRGRSKERELTGML
jgi:hypothetical protein